MADRLILRLSDRWAILADRQQWILSKWMRRQRSEIGKEGYWKPVGYVGCHKRVLARLFRENRVGVIPEAQAIFDSWPERFLDWRPK